MTKEKKQEEVKVSSKVSMVVGIGASAGGLEALQQLLQNLPNNTDACFIIVQHLSPDYKSMMVELLKKHTTMSLHEISEGNNIQPNSIFLLPAKKDLEIIDGTLHLKEKFATTVVNHTIDNFFVSLAKDQKEKAIGIVLSGTGSDGSAGLKALKELGALAIAQKPQSAKFDGMPNSAINTGLIDLVLTPQEIGKHLETYIQQPDISEEQRELTEEDKKNNLILNEMLTLLQETSHIEFSKYKGLTLLRRIQRRMKIRCVQSLSLYLSILMKERNELDLLTHDFLIGVTEFFRDKDAFKKLETDVIPDLVMNADPSETLKVWVPACSTGEEAYSIAMLIHNELTAQRKSLQVKIFATDVNRNAIDFASEGVYSDSISKQLPKDLKEKYFSQLKDGRYRISKEIRSMVIFASHDILKDAPFSKIAFVSCRNFLIYIKTEFQQNVLDALHFSLNKQGVLFVGSSENIGTHTDYFDAIDARHRIYRKVRDAKMFTSISDGITSSNNRMRSLRTPSVESLLRNYRQSSVKQNIGFANEALIKQFMSPCVLLSDDMTALHVYGDVSPFVKQLSPGRISTSIQDMINEDISLALVSATAKAKKNQKQVRLSELSTQFQGDTIKFDLNVIYFKEHDLASQPGYFWVIFDNLETFKNQTSERYDLDLQAKQRISFLENELKANKEHLQVMVEELETTNEELQSANEELMSSNEELQSTNEELQSVNEELHTVNAEYQEKIEEISGTNNDLDKVLLLSDIGIIFLDSSLLIRKYTDAVKKYVNLLESDIERPFYHISNNIPYPLLMDDISKVLQSGTPCEREIVLKNRNILRITISPYNQIGYPNDHGIAITFNDITMAKYSEKSMVQTYKVLQNAIKHLTQANLEPLNNQKLDLLLVDDNKNYLDVLSYNLNKIPDYEINIRTSSTVDQAYNEINKHLPDVCIIDFYLKNNTAMDLVEKIDNAKINLPFVIISSKADDDLIPMLLSHGLLELVEKDDITPSLLLESITNALKRQELMGWNLSISSENQ